MQDDPERTDVDFPDRPERTDIRVILGYVRVDRRSSEAERRQTQQHLELLNRTLQELDQSIVGLQRSIVNLETTIEHLDDRIDARFWKHTWVTLGGVAAIVRATAAVVALSS